MMHHIPAPERGSPPTPQNIPPSKAPAQTPNITAARREEISLPAIDPVTQHEIHEPETAPETDAPVITVINSTGPGTKSVSTLSEIHELALAKEQAEEDSVTWIDISKPTEEIYRVLKEHYSLDEDALEECKKYDEHAHAEERDGALYVGQHSFSYDKKKGLEASETHFIIGKKVIITLHDGENEALINTAKSYEEGKNENDHSIQTIALRLSGEIHRANKQSINDIRDRLDRFLTSVEEEPDRSRPALTRDLRQIGREIRSVDRIYRDQRDLPMMIDQLLEKDNSRATPSAVERNWKTHLDYAITDLEDIQKRIEDIRRTVDENRRARNEQEQAKNSRWINLLGLGGLTTYPLILAANWANVIEPTLLDTMRPYLHWGAIGLSVASVALAVKTKLFGSTKHARSEEEEFFGKEEDGNGHRKK